MEDPIRAEQAMALGAALLSNVSFEGLRPYRVQEMIDSPKKLGEAFTLLLQNGGRLPNPGVYIDRSGPVDFGRYGNPIVSTPLRLVDEDERALGVKFLTLADIKLVSLLDKGEDYISGKEAVRRARAKPGYAALDYTAAMEVFRHFRHVFPLAWRKFRIFIDGTTVMHPFGRNLQRCSFVMQYDGDWDMKLAQLYEDPSVYARRENWLTAMIRVKKKP